MRLSPLFYIWGKRRGTPATFTCAGQAEGGAAEGPQAGMETAVARSGIFCPTFPGASLSDCVIRLVITGQHLINISCFCDLAKLVLPLCTNEGGHITLEVVFGGVPRIQWRSLGSLCLAGGGGEPSLT